MARREKTAVRQALGACRGAMLAVGLFSFAVNLLMLTAPLYMLQVFDRVLPSRSVETLVLLTLVAAGAFVVMAALEVVRSRILVRVSTRLDMALSSQALTAAITAALRGGGHSVQPLRDVTQLRTFLSSTGILSLFDAPWSPIYLAVIYLFHPLLGVVALGGAILLFVLAIINELVTRGPLGEANAKSVVALKRAEASVRNADVAEAMGMTGGLLRRWQVDNAGVIGLQARASGRAGYITSIVRFLRLLLQVGVYGVGAWLAVEQFITPGVMFAAALLMARALAPVESAIGTWHNLVSARAAYRRLDELLTRAPVRPLAMALPRPQGRLSVERLVFAPPGAENAVLKGISFELEPGQALGVIGPTAAGKSTLARLLVGSWQPTAGKVRLDDADVYAWDRNDFGRHVGYLPQDVELFAGSVRDNIARFSDAEPEAIVAAATMAGVHEMILRLPRGYETEIGDGGEALSGGQRQRIALARALLGSPRFLVLDEPNANLDPEGERALVQALMAAKAAGVTTVVIAHRPNILEQVDKMLVLRNGMVEVFGPRAEIMDSASRIVPATDVAKARLGTVAKFGPSGKSQGM